MTIIGLLVFVLILCLIWWALQTLSTAFGLPTQIRAVITVIVVVLAVLYLLSAFGLMSAGPVIRLH